MRGKVAAAAAALLTAGAGFAAAAPPATPAAATPSPRPAGADRPPLLPTRESSVLYRISASGGPPADVRVTLQASGGAMRLDLPDQTYLLVHPAEKRMAMVVPTELMVMDLPLQPGLQDQFLLNSRMRFSRRGPETVAGIRCTAWDVVADGGRGIMWITDEGVVLKSVSLDPQGRRNLIEAISVSYTPASASEYEPPAGFDHMAGPAAGPPVR